MIKGSHKNRETGETETGTENTKSSTDTITDDQYRATVQHTWIEFTVEARCYVEGIYLEAGQPLTLSPAASYRQRNNKNLHPTKEMTWPTLSKTQLKDLAEGDPKVGAAPKEFTLVQPGGQPK
jgi:hypothetical protein